MPEEIAGFCAGKRAVLVVEEGQPEFIEQEIARDAAPRATSPTPVAGQGPAADGRRIHGRGRSRAGSPSSSAAHAPELPTSTRATRGSTRRDARRDAVAKALGSAAAGAAAAVLHRLSRAAGVRGAEARAAGRSARCTSRPTSAATAFATFEPFSIGPLDPRLRHEPREPRGRVADDARRALAIMGDGGFWHNGLVTGVQSALFNGDDAVLADHEERLHVGDRHAGDHVDAGDAAQGAADDKGAASSTRNQHDRDARCEGIGVEVAAHGATATTSTTMRATLEEAFTTDFAGLKVIIAEGECQLERQRRVKPWRAELRARGQARRARQVRRRRGHVLGRPLVHPAVGLPDAVGQGQRRPAARSTRWRPCSTAASAAGCAARTRTRRRCARRSTAPR